MKYKNLFAKDYDSEEDDEDDDHLWTPKQETSKTKPTKPSASNKRPKKISEVKRNMEIPRKKFNYYIVTFIDKPYEKIDNYVCIPATWIYRLKFIEPRENDRVPIIYPRNDCDPILTNYRVRTNEKPHKNWKMYMADIIHESETYDAAKSWITQKKSERSSDEVTLRGTQLESVVDKKPQYGTSLEPEKLQIKPNRILRQNRIEQPIIQLERLELGSLEDEDTTEIHDLFGTIEITDNLKQEEPMISITNELTESPASNFENSSEHFTTNSCCPKIQSVQSITPTCFTGTFEDKKNQNEKLPIPTNSVSNDENVCQILNLASHPEAVNLRPTPNSHVKGVCDRFSNESNDSNTKPQPDNTLQIKTTPEKKHEYPLLFFPASTSFHNNTQPQVTGKRNFNQVVHNKKRQYQELVANAPSSIHHVPSKITEPSQIPTNRYNLSSTNIPDHSDAKKSRLESNTQHIHNIQELINKTVQKSLPVQNHIENVLQVNTTQNNMKRYFPNLDRQVFNMPQISAATSFSHLAQQSRFIEHSQRLYRPYSSQVHPNKIYQMQHNKPYRDIYKQPNPVQNIYQNRCPPVMKTAARNQPNPNIILNPNTNTTNQLQPINRNYSKEIPKLQSNPIGTAKPQHSLYYQYNIQNARSMAQIPDTSNISYQADRLKNQKGLQPSVIIQNDCILQAGRNFQNTQDDVNVHAQPSSNSSQYNLNLKKGVRVTSTGTKCVPPYPLAQTEQLSNRLLVESSLVQGNLNSCSSNNFQTRISITNNMGKNTKHAQNKTQVKEQIKSKLAAEQETLDTFGTLFAEMASYLCCTSNKYNNTIQSSISELNETYELLEKKINLLNSIDILSGISKKVTINVPENISVNIPDMTKYKINETIVDACDGVNENREHRCPFVLPPEYNPKDSKWTLKYRENGPGLVELIPGNGIYVKKINLKKILRQSTNRKTLALNLLTEIFSENALSVCSLTGSRAKAFGSQIKYVRPGLDAHAKDVLLYFVEQYAKKRSTNRNWNDPGTAAIMQAIRGRINWCREKWSRYKKRTS